MRSLQTEDGLNMLEPRSRVGTFALSKQHHRSLVLGLVPQFRPGPRLSGDTTPLLQCLLDALFVFEFREKPGKVALHLAVLWMALSKLEVGLLCQLQLPGDR